MSKSIEIDYLKNITLQDAIQIFETIKESPALRQQVTVTLTSQEKAVLRQLKQKIEDWQKTSLSKQLEIPF